MNHPPGGKRRLSILFAKLRVSTAKYSATCGVRPMPCICKKLGSTRLMLCRWIATDVANLDPTAQWPTRCLVEGEGRASVSCWIGADLSTDSGGSAGRRESPPPVYSMANRTPVRTTGAQLWQLTPGRSGTDKWAVFIIVSRSTEQADLRGMPARELKGCGWAARSARGLGLGDQKTRRPLPALRSDGMAALASRVQYETFRRMSRCVSP